MSARADIGNAGARSPLGAGVEIHSRIDAAIWRAVDMSFTAREQENDVPGREITKQAIRELELEFHRARAAKFIPDEPIADVPAPVHPEAEAAA